MEKLKIDPISALAVKWGLKAFDASSIDAFISHLDFSSADKLYEECSSICNWYEEVVLNRKFFITKTIEHELQKNDKDHTIINLAAGKSPLALHILSRNKNRISKIVEVDVSGMEEKQELYDRYYPEFAHKIKCITADITSESFLIFIQQIVTEFFNENPCIVILEGIIYYLHQDDFSNIIKKFVSKEKSNTLIIEYLLDDSLIREARKDIPRKVFEKFQKELSLDSISSYKRDYITSLFIETGGELVSHKTLMDMELDRTGTNNYFNGDDDGWIECCVWKL